MALTITTQVTLNKEMVVGSRLSMIVTLEGLLNIPIPCFDIFEGTLLGSWCQQYSSEIISVTIFVQWIRCGRVAWDGGGDWDLWGELARRPGLQIALGTRFIIYPWLFLKPWFLLSIFFLHILGEHWSSWRKGVYGSGEPLVITFKDIPNIFLPFLKVFISLSFPQGFLKDTIQWWWQSRYFYDNCPSWSSPGHDEVRGDFPNSVRRELCLRLDQGCSRPLNLADHLMRGVNASFCVLSVGSRNLCLIGTKWK